MSIAAHLRVLGLDSFPMPTWIQIKKAYKDRILVAHPDKGGSAEQFRAINDAFNALKDVAAYVVAAAAAPPTTTTSCGANAASAFTRVIELHKEARAHVLGTKMSLAMSLAGFYTRHVDTGHEARCIHKFYKHSVKVTIAINNIHDAHCDIVLRYGQVPDIVVCKNVVSEVPTRTTFKWPKGSMWAETRFLWDEGSLYAVELLERASSRVGSPIADFKRFIDDSIEEMKRSEVRMHDMDAYIAKATANGLFKMSEMKNECVLASELLVADAQAHLRLAQDAEKKALARRALIQGTIDAKIYVATDDVERDICLAQDRIHHLIKFSSGINSSRLVHTGSVAVPLKCK